MQRDHEYKRSGTVTLPAAADPMSGFMHRLATLRHGSFEFTAFLEQLDAHQPAEMPVRPLLPSPDPKGSGEDTRCLAGSRPRSIGPAPANEASIHENPHVVLTLNQPNCA